VLKAGWKVRFYRIRPDLSIDLENLESCLSNDVAAILVIHFLGFPTPLDDILRFRDRFACYVIEDWAHSFLQGPDVHLSGDRGDFALLSFYKHAPSFAGGGFRVNLPVSWLTTPQQSAGWREAARITKRLVEQAIDNAQDGIAKRAFQTVEQWRVQKKSLQQNSTHTSAEPSEPAYEFSDKLAVCGIPWLSRKVLEAAPWASIFRVRRQNYEYLAKHLDENPRLRRMVPTLPPDVCPWAFPVWLPSRSEHDIQLRAAGVPLFTFGEVLHATLRQCPGPTLEDAEDLSKHLLLLSVHQNLTLQDMERVSQIVNGFFRRRTSVGNCVSCS
jgi:hypothetical protein